MVPGKHHVVHFAGLDEDVVHAGGELGGHVQLPAELSDVRDATGANAGVAEIDLLRGAERERRRRRGPRGVSGWSSWRALGPMMLNTADPDVMSTARARSSGPMWFLQPVEVADLGGCGGDDQVAVGGFAGDGEVGFDAAVVVEPLGVDDLADGDGDIVRADVVEDPFGVGAFEAVLGER